ncbi:Transposon Ty2-B Gag-Pol polyprotein [Porphyridium purpureum]|uniref:Transposon Ty2-B Gag-Pol polyprotein n=1 Tax=Porphyridium purpureum TaxID=35688 RepID=A0A5J4YMW2_PORPP|nr:Transposon Ty2-B Gag-Pol polyprotein [Porphyridium purpureum]|eukprot:POR3023..scf244_11
MDRQQGLESNAWHRRRNKRIRCDGTRCDFTVPEDEGLTYSTRLHMMQSHKRKCKLRMHPNRLPYTQAYLFDADDGSLQREDSPDDTGSANTETRTGRGSELPDIRMDDEDPEMQFHSDRDIDSGCESLHANLTQDAEMYLRPMEPVRGGEEGEEQVEYILGPYAKHFNALLNQKTLRERLQDRDDEMSKFVRSLTGAGEMEDVDLDEAIEMIRFKNDQEVFIQKHGISVRHATDLKSIEAKLLRIAIRMTLRQVSQLTKHSFTMLKRYPLNHEASRIDAVYAALQSKLNIASSHVLKRATKLLFTFRSSKRMSSLLGNPSIKPVETYVEYGRGIRLRRNTLRRNVKQTIRFREPMDIVMRSAAAIIDEYGLEPFVIDLFKTRDREIVMHPQDGNLCISAARRIEFEVNRKHGPDPPQVVILPIQIFADESHMTQNGRHTVTPLKIRIVHRRLFDTHSSRIPQVVAYLPPVDTRSIARAFGEETSIRIDPKLAKRELESSMYHAIMNKAFHHLMIANKFGVPVLWNHRRLLLFPIAYKLSMDMPMISKCSFTKASFVSGSRARTMPCHQCMVIAPEATTRAVEAGPNSDASKAEEFWITRIPLQYRCEKQVEPFITQNLSAWGTLQRKEQSLHFLGDSAAIGWNRFDDDDDVAFNATISAFKHKIHLRNRGRFQLTGIDGLHGFLAFWLRGITIAGLKALLSKPNTVHEVGLVAERLTEAQQRATRHLNEVEHSDFPRMWASLDFDEQRHGSASEDTSGDDSESHDEYSSDDDIVRANERNSSQTNTRQRPKAKAKTNDSHINPRRAESNRKGSVSDQLRGIIDSAAGKAWNQIATEITDEARFRRPATYSPIRLSSFLSDLPKFAEQSYSLGFLLQMIVLVHQEHLLSDRTRESFTELATRCIRLYGVLYKEKLRRPWLELIPRLTSDLQSRLDSYKRQINLRWNAPKIHALSHFGDNLTDLGPIKFWDTTDGEKSFQIDKAWFKSLVSADTNIPHNVMLQRAEVFEIGSSSSYWFDKLARNKDSNAIAYTHEQVSDEAYTHTRESDAARAWYRHRSSSVNCSSILFGIWQNACTTLRYSSESGFEAAPSWRPTSWNPSISFESADDEETNMLWLHTDTALKTYASEKLQTAVNDGTATFQAFRQVQLKKPRDEAECIVAHPNHYRSPRWDILEYALQTGHPERHGYGKCILIVRIKLQGPYDESFDVVVIQDLEAHDGEIEKSECKCKCKRLDPVFHHYRLSNNSVKVLDTETITGRVTAFKDIRMKDSRWYYLLNPSTFEGFFERCERGTANSCTLHAYINFSFSFSFSVSFSLHLCHGLSTSNVQATFEVGSMEIQSDNDRSDVPYTDGTSQGARVAMSKSEETFMRRYSAFTKAYQSVDSKFYGTDEENFAAWRMQLVNHLALHNLDDQYTAQVIQACLAGDALTFYLGTYVDEDLTKFTIADVLVGLRDHFYTIEKLERLQEQWEKANFAEFQANNSNISEVENCKSLTQRLKRIQPNLKKPYRSHEMLRDKYKQIMFRHPVYERLVMTPLPTSADALCSKIEALLLHMQPSTVSPKPQLAFTAQQTSRAPMAQPNHSVTLYQERYRRSRAKPQANRARSTPRPISIASASNPRTANGTQLLCDICQSEKHFRRFCPDKEAKRKFYTANSNYMVADFLGSDSSSGADASDSTDDVTHTDLVWLSPSLVLFQHDTAFVIVDSGASGGNLVGERFCQARQTVQVTAPPRRVKMGTSVFDTRGQAKIVMLDIGGAKLEFFADVIQLDIPPLLGWREQKARHMTVDAGAGILTALADSEQLKFRVHTIAGLPCILLPNPENPDSVKEQRDDIVLFTATELRRLHVHFGHAHLDKIRDLLQRSGQRLTSAEIRWYADIVQKCKACQFYADVPRRPIVAMPVNPFFNRDIAIDTVYFDGLAVLHIVCKGTKYARNPILRRTDAVTVISTFYTSWITIFGIPATLSMDRGTEFLNAALLEFCDGLGIVMHRDCELLLAQAEFALNATLGNRDTCPFLLVFGQLPVFTLGTVQDQHKMTTDRHMAMEVARRTTEGIIATRRIREATHISVSKSAPALLSRGDRVLFWRPSERAWVGPATVVHVHGDAKTVKVEYKTRNYHPALHQVKLFVADQVLWADETETFSKILQVSEHSLRRKCDFTISRAKEIDGWHAKGVVEAVRTTERANLDTRWVDSIKLSDGKEFPKSRLALREFAKSQPHGSMLRDSPTTSRWTVRVLLSVALNQSWSISSSDVEQAFLQSQPLKRRVLVQPPKEAGLPSGVLWLLKKAAYGLVDAAYIWYESLRDVLVNKMQMKESMVDPCLFVANEGACTTQVDDILTVGTPQFLEAQKEIRKYLQLHREKRDKFIFNGAQLTVKENCVSIDLRAYIEKSRIVAVRITTYSDFQRFRGQLLWLAANSRPDLAYPAAQLSQISQDMFDHKVYKELVDQARGAVCTMPYLHFNRLHGTVAIQVFADASFANNVDLSSQLGFIICLADSQGHYNIVHWRSGKSRRVVKSTLAAETLAVIDAFDHAGAVKHMLQELGIPSPEVILYTDNRSVFDAMSKRTACTEKAVQISVAILRQALQEAALTKIGLLLSADNPADALTKARGNSELDSLLRAEVYHPKVVEWFEVKK